MLRIADAPRDITFDDQVLLVARQKLARPWIVYSQPAIEVSSALEKPLGVQACVGNGTDGPAELRDQRELSLPHGKQRQPGQQHQRGCRANAVMSFCKMHAIIPSYITAPDPGCREAPLPRHPPAAINDG